MKLHEKRAKIGTKSRPNIEEMNQGL